MELPLTRTVTYGYNCPINSCRSLTRPEGSTSYGYNSAGLLSP